MTSSCLSASVSLQLVFLRLAPPPTLTVRGRRSTMVFLAIAPSSEICFAVVPFPFRPTPPATPAVCGRFLIGGLLITGSAFPSISFLRVTWLHTQAV